MPTEEQLSAINAGRMSNILLDALKPELSYLRELAITRMKHMYRDGSATEMKLIAHVAEMCAIDDIESRLRTKVRRGSESFKEIDKDGE